MGVPTLPSTYSIRIYNRLPLTSRNIPDYLLFWIFYKLCTIVWYIFCGLYVLHDILYDTKPHIIVKQYGPKQVVISKLKTNHCQSHYFWSLYAIQKTMDSSWHNYSSKDSKQSIVDGSMFSRQWWDNLEHSYAKNIHMNPNDTCLNLSESISRSSSSIVMI